MYSEDIVSSRANVNFLREEKFISAYQKTVEADNGRLLGTTGYSIRWRIHTLLWAAKHATNLEGDFIDFGGGFGLFASAIYEYLDFQDIPKRYYMLDSFQGLDDSSLTPTEIEKIRSGQNGSNIFKRYGNWTDEMVSKFQKFKNMTVIPGFVPETLEKIDSDKFSFCSIDMNALNPEYHALKFIWDKMVTGGIIVFDDYGFSGHEEQKSSHDQFAREHNSSIFTCPTGQGILIKS